VLFGQVRCFRPAQTQSAGFPLFHPLSIRIVFAIPSLTYNNEEGVDLTFAARIAVYLLSATIAATPEQCYAAPQSDGTIPTKSSGLEDKTQTSANKASRNKAADDSHNPQQMGTTYVPLDSWIYPALDRLFALGYHQPGFAGMRPWTRMECARLIDESKDFVGVREFLNENEADLLNHLEEEFSYELGLLQGQRNLNATIESVYARGISIAGPDLADSYHFGQTISYDFGRPFERGTNGQFGSAIRAVDGPFAFYLRAEYQHAPSAPAYSEAVRNVIALEDSIPVPPSLNVNSINRPRVLDAYIAMNLNWLKLDNWQLSVGQQSHSWGPGLGAFLLSNNAEPIDMIDVVNPGPIRLPLLLRLLGPVRIDQFIGMLEGRTDHRHPWVYGQKISFKPLSCLEIGYGRITTIGGRGGDPLTLHNFLFSMFGKTSKSEPGDSIPGENNNEMDWTFYVPKVHNYIVLYGEVYAFDDFIAWVRPTAYPYRPGIYISRIPGIPQLDLHIEAANTQAPGWNGASGGNNGQVVYFNSSYHEANTNDGFLMGNPVGRDGQTIQGWLAYWRSPTNTFQLSYKNNFVDPAFIPGGGAWQDYSLRNEFHFRSGVYVKSQLQYEHISHYPLLFNGRRQNVTAIVELGLMPDKKTKSLSVRH
jgi:hypothetical protein